MDNKEMFKELSITKQISAEANTTRIQLESEHKEKLEMLRKNDANSFSRFTVIKNLLIGLYIIVGLLVLFAALNFWKLNYG